MEQALEIIETVLCSLAIIEAVAILIAVKIIKFQDEQLEAEIRNNEELRVLYERLVRGEEDGK